MGLAQLEIPLETVACLAEICKELSIPLMLDPAPAQHLDPTTLSRVTWFTPNQTEALFYAEGAQTSEQILSRLFASGIQNVLLKLGSEGSLLAASDGTRCEVPVFSVNAIDTTAAGDAFNGAFAVAQLTGLDMKSSGEYAAAAAAISVTRKGAQPSLANASEVQAFLSRTHPSSFQSPSSRVP